MPQAAARIGPRIAGLLLVVAVAAGQEPGRNSPRAATQPVAASQSADDAPGARDPARVGKPASDEDVYAALRRPLGEVNWHDTPFETLIRDLRRRLAINVHVERQQLTDLGVSLDRPVTMTLKNLPMQRLLRLVLEDVGNGDVELGCAVQDGVLVISTAEALGREPVVRTYDVRDLIGADAARTQPNERESPLKPPPGLRGSEESAAAPEQPGTAETGRPLTQQLIDAIVQAVAPESWTSNGGTATLTEMDGALVVRNTARNQQQLRHLLDALRNVPYAGSLWATAQGEVDSPADEPIRAALRRVLPAASYDGVPLAGVIDDLRRRLDVNVHVFASELADAGVDVDTPVELELHDVTGEQVLRRLLKDVEPDAHLEFEVQAGVLVIAPRDHFARQQVVRVYDVGDLAPSAAKRERLLALICAAIEADSWAVNGGAATASYFGNRLVVRQAVRVHRQIEALSQQFRESKPATRPAPRP